MKRTLFVLVCAGSFSSSAFAQLNHREANLVLGTATVLEQSANVMKAAKVGMHALHFGGAVMGNGQLMLRARPDHGSKAALNPVAAVMPCRHEEEV